MKSKNSEARGQKQEARGQKQEAREQRSEARSQRTEAIFTTLLLSLLLSTAALAQTYVSLPFEDNFDNGAQANSDSVTNFWNSFSVGTQGSVQETGGNWVITAGPHGSSAGTPLTGSPAVSVMSRTAGEQMFFNLFDEEAGLQVRGVGMEFVPGDGPETGTVRNASAVRARFGFGAKGLSTYQASDSLAVVLYGDGRVQAGVKINGGVSDPETAAATKALDFYLPAPATGFDFRFDDPTDGVYSHFTLTLYYGENQSYQTNVAVKTAFSVSDWGDGDGKAWLIVGAQRSNATDPQDSARVTVGSVAVTPILSPGLYLIGYLPPQRPDFKAALRPKTELN